jgi:hypothetical protein
MTQLNLSGRQSTDTKRNSATEATEAKDESIKNQTVGALGALAMFAAVIVIGSCSRSSKPVAVQQPIQPMAPVSAPATAVAAPAPEPVAVKAKAKTKRRPATTVSYVNPEYGVSFSFPRQFSLKSGDAAQLSWGDLGPFQMDFVHPGGVTLAGVTLPGNSYPGTDFRSAFVNLSVNPRMTAEACTQFAFPEVKGGTETSPPNAGEATGKDAAAQVKVGAVEFSEVENSTTAATRQTNAKYYHAFSNGACYEFALGLGTETDGSAKGIKPVDRQEVFAKLEKILATVKLQPAAAPETETATPSAKTVAPDASSITTNGTTSTPNGGSNTPERSTIDRNY